MASRVKGNQFPILSADGCWPMYLSLASLMALPGLGSLGMVLQPVSSVDFNRGDGGQVKARGTLPSEHMVNNA